MLIITPTQLNRFMNKLDKASSPIGCWLWTGKTRTQWGYGRVGIGGKYPVVHRVAYEAFVGPIPDGMSVLHRCDVPACCNPDHLFLGTHQDNMDDMVNKKRSIGGNHRTLNESDVIAIRNRFTDGTDRGELALMFGVSRTQINRIINRSMWKHVL